MTKFKNYVSYSGNKEQLERFAAELIRLGYKPNCHDKFSKWSDDRESILLNAYDFENGIFGFYNHDGTGFPIRFGPDQFEEALKAAKEPA